MASIWGKLLTMAAIAAVPVSLHSRETNAVELTPIEKLGKAVFFDTSLSVPGQKQGCVSCHSPAKGWVFPNAAVNSTTVVAPGAAPHRLGGIKPPSNAYASKSPVFQEGIFPFAPGFVGGNFWDGRAEGCGGAPGSKCPVSVAGIVSETITPSVFQPPNAAMSGYEIYLGPTADQALNPFPRGVERTRAKSTSARKSRPPRIRACIRRPMACRSTAAPRLFTKASSALPWRSPRGRTRTRWSLSTPGGTKRSPPMTTGSSR